MYISRRRQIAGETEHFIDVPAINDIVQRNNQLYELALNHNRYLLMITVINGVGVDLHLHRVHFLVHLFIHSSSLPGRAGVQSARGQHHASYPARSTQYCVTSVAPSVHPSVCLSVLLPLGKLQPRNRQLHRASDDGNPRFHIDDKQMLRDSAGMEKIMQDPAKKKTCFTALLLLHIH